MFASVAYSGSHQTSILQVAAGEIDLAATNDMDLAKMIQKHAVNKEDIRVVYKSDLIPGSPFVRSSLPLSLKQAFKAAMLKLNDQPELLENFRRGGYAEVDDGEFDIIRAMAISTGTAAGRIAISVAERCQRTRSFECTAPQPFRRPTRKNKNKRLAK